jgi:hypothetical protein
VTVDRSHVLATPGIDRHGAYVVLSRHRDGVDMHYGRDDFSDESRLVRTLARERVKDMATDYQPAREPMAEPRRAFAERRGITLREHVTQIAREVAGKVRGMVDDLRFPTISAREAETSQRPDRVAESPPGLQSPASGRARAPQGDPEREARRLRTEALKRHGRAYDAVFGARAAAGEATPERLRELDDARAAFDKVRPFGSRDAEAGYAKDPTIAADVARGSHDRAIRAIQFESELRTVDQRADQFVKRWQGLDAASQQHYELGDMSAYKASQRAMGDMARSLQRDPQLESILANHKLELGITISSGRSLGAELAYNHGIDIGVGRGLGL